MTIEDIQGFEYDWLAIDAGGFVALLSTAGGGFAPESFCEDLNAYDAAIEALLGLPARTRAKCKRELPAEVTNTWRLMAERGVFAFDSDPLGGPYKLVSVPEVPIHIGELPFHIANVAQRIVLARLSFIESDLLSESQLRGAVLLSYPPGERAPGRPRGENAPSPAPRGPQPDPK
jgi:hypothetical protein